MSVSRYTRWYLNRETIAGLIEQHEKGKIDLDRLTALLADLVIGERTDYKIPLGQ